MVTIDFCPMYRFSLFVIVEAPWSAAEWAVALLLVELLQAQLGRQVPYYYYYYY